MKNVQKFIPAAINELKNNSQNGSHTQYYQQNQGRAISESDVEIIKNVFIALQGNFPAWKQVWPDVPSLNTAKKEWTKAFIEAGISSMEQIQNGLRQCRQHSSNWPPSTGVFIKWCKQASDTPESLGLPSADKAYLQACAASHPAADSSRLHPAVWHAACETGLYLLARQPESKSRPAFERAYALTIEMIIRGEPLREIPKALPASVHVPASLDRARSALDEIRKKLAGVNP